MAKNNIYKHKEGAYYYAERRLKNSDTLIESDVSIEYSFNFCQNRNYGIKDNEVSKKAPNPFTMTEKRQGAITQAAIEMDRKLKR